MKAIISGGGTGGHIFPAISIANKIKERYSDAEILFVGAEDRMEMERIPAAGYKIVGLPIQGFARKRLLKNVVTAIKIWKSVKKSNKIIKDFKPDIAIGVGGYASGPLLYAASKAGIPSLIQEQNSYAGVTNKLLAKRVSKICVAYDNMEAFFPAEKIVKTGNPVRQSIVNMNVTKEEGMAHFGIGTGRKIILIIGGSLGARTINNSVIRNLNMLNQHNIQIIWQTGKYYYEESLKVARGYKNVIVMEFIKEMEMAYAAADIIVSRAGAGTISELCIVGKPCLLVPSPNVAEDHQTANTKALVNKSAAVMVTDANAVSDLFVKAIDMLNNQSILNVLSKNIKAMEITNSADLIVDEIENILKK